MNKCSRSCESPLKSSSKTLMLKKICEHSKGIATKILRIPNLGKLKEFYESDEIDFQLIQLIRDPRSMQASRIKMSKDWILHGWEPDPFTFSLERLEIDCENGVRNSEKKFIYLYRVFTVVYKGCPNC